MVKTDIAPMTQNPGVDDIQLWKRVGSTEVWMGFFYSAKDGLDWIRAHPGNYVLNNVPPPTSNSRREDIDPIRGRVQKVAKKAKPERFSPIQQPVAVKTFKPKSAAEKALERDAKAIINQHRADEAAELAQED